LKANIMASAVEILFLYYTK